MIYRVEASYEFGVWAWRLERRNFADFWATLAVYTKRDVAIAEGVRLALQGHQVEFPE
jgi:hypothetical protein